MRILWIIDFEYGPRFHHGGYLRFFNFAPQLIAQGHSFTFVVNFTDPDPRPSIEYLRNLKTQGVFTDFVEATYEVPLWRRRVSARLIYPGLMNMVLRGNQRRHADRVDAIARERGIAAYRAWVPFERIRPANVPQEQWEAAFAWPPDNRPPYPPLIYRLMRGLLSYLLVILGVAALFQLFTPFPALAWLGRLLHIWFN